MREVIKVDSAPFFGFDDNSESQLYSDLDTGIVPFFQSESYELFTMS